MDVHGDFSPLNRGLVRQQATFGRTLGRMEQTAKRSFSRIGALGVGAIGAFASFSAAKGAVQGTEDLAKATLALHRNLGFTITDASRWAAVAKARGVDTSNLSTSFTALSKAVEGALAPKPVAASAKAFKDLGITQEQLKAGQKDFAGLVNNVSDALAGMEGGTQRAKIAQQLLGRSSQDTLPIFTAGSKALKEQLALADKYGVTLNGKTIKSVDELRKVSRELEFAQMGLQVQFTQTFGPVLTKALAGASTFINQTRRIFNRDDLTGEEKWNRFADMVSGKVTDATPKIADAAGRVAPQVALGFVRGFLRADAWGQIAIGTFLVSKLVGWGTIFRAAGGKAVAAFSQTFTPAMGAEGVVGGTTAAAGTAATTPRFAAAGAEAGTAFGTAYRTTSMGIVVPTAVAEAAAAGAPVPFGRAGTRAGRIFGAAFRVAGLAAVAVFAVEAMKKIQDVTGGGLSASSRENFATKLSQQGWTDIQFIGKNRVRGRDPQGRVRTVTAKQRGGFIHGSGIGDKVHALLEPGEGVVNKSAVKAMGGPPAIDAINQAFPRFQKGGTVGASRDTAARSKAYKFAHEIWPPVATRLRAQGMPMPKVEFRGSDKATSYQPGPGTISVTQGKSGLDKIVGPPWWMQNLARRMYEGLYILTHEFGHIFQLDPRNLAQQEGGAEGFAGRVAPGVANTLGIEPKPMPSPYRQQIRQLKKQRGKGYEQYVLNRQFGFDSKGRETKAKKAADQSLGGQLWYEPQAFDKGGVVASRTEQVPGLKGETTWADVGEKIRKRMRLVWGVASPYFRATGEPMPLMRFPKHEKSKLSPYAWVTPGTNKVTFSPTARAQFAQGDDWAEKSLLHEWAHIFQGEGPGKMMKTWEAEGGAEGFAQRVSGPVYRKLQIPFKRTPDAYPVWTRRVREEKGDKWILGGQFGYTPGRGGGRQQSPPGVGGPEGSLPGDIPSGPTGPGALPKSNRFTSTAYGPPWDKVQGTGVTKTGIDLRPAKKAFIVAVDPAVIPLHSKLTAHPNPFRRTGTFAAEDIGGKVDGRHIDFYDWRGRASQQAWGRRSVNVAVKGKGGAAPPVGTQGPQGPKTPKTYGYAYPLAQRGKIIGTPYAGTHNLGNWQSDNAVDISAPIGTIVQAVADGKIIKTGGSGSFAGRFGGYNMTLQSRNNAFFYAHLKKLSVNAGKQVSKAQSIGQSGSANGVAHLHFGQQHGSPLGTAKGPVGTPTGPTTVQGVQVRGPVTFKGLLDALGQKLQARYDLAKLTPKPYDDLRALKSLIAYSKGRLKVAKGNRNYAEISEFASALGGFRTDYKDIRKGIRGELKLDESLFKLDDLTYLGSGPNKFNIGGLQTTLDNIALESARAGLTTVPGNLDPDSPGYQSALSASLQDDLSAATRLKNTWEGIWQATDKRGTPRQKTEAATELKTARDALKSIQDEIDAKPESATTADDGRRTAILEQLLEETRKGAASDRAQTPIFQRFNQLPKFHDGGIYKGSEGPAILKRNEGVFTEEQMAAMGGQTVLVIVEDGAVDQGKIRVVAEEAMTAREREMVRRARSAGPTTGVKMRLPA